MTKFAILTEVISQRKAIRCYQNQKIPFELVEEVIKIACRAPSWFGTEPWFILVIDSEKLKKDLYPLINQQSQVLECSHLFLLFSAKKTRLTPEIAKRQCFVLLQNFLLLFTSLNIATCPMGGFQETEIIAYCEKNNYILPDYYNLAVIFTAGYPQSEKDWAKEIKQKDWTKVYKIV